MRRVTPFLLAVLALATAAVPASAQSRANACEPYAARPCLLPFPNDLHTVKDPSTPTGRRVALPQAAMPANRAGNPIGVEEYNRNDGFSPGSTLILRVPGLDTPKAFKRSKLVPITDMGRYRDRRQPVVVINARTRQRQLIWSELDSNAENPADVNLLIRPGKNWREGERYIVALRNLKTAGGKTIPAPKWFAKLRDGRKLSGALARDRLRYARIFRTLARAKVRRADLYVAWDFTVASGKSLTSRAVAIRDDAFAQLGDTNLADGVVQGTAPTFVVDPIPATDTTKLDPRLTAVTGNFTVPCYLNQPGCPPGASFNYASDGKDALPTQIPGNVTLAPFYCIYPKGLTAPARALQYGHGLLGSGNQVFSEDDLANLAVEGSFVICATDWKGMASDDVVNAAQILADLDKFPSLADRLQQGFVNQMYLGRLMRHPQGFAASPAFQNAGASVFDPSKLYFDSNSQGGILGGALGALAPDWTRGVLGVPAMNYSVLLPRSVDFDTYAQVLNPAYPDASVRPLALSLIQMLWDRGENQGYAQQMTGKPLPNTPAGKKYLLHPAVGDHQVANVQNDVLARTIGARTNCPAFEKGRSIDSKPLYAIPCVKRFPYTGSAALVYWDSGKGVVPWPEPRNLPTRGGSDPHQHPRDTVAARRQKARFLREGGSVEDVCAGKPCRTDAYKR